MAGDKAIGERISMLVKMSGRSQSDLADLAGMPTSQLNRFLNGHCELTSDNFVAVLQALGISIEEIITQRLKNSVAKEEFKLENHSDCVNFLFSKLDRIGQQTYLNNLAWAAKISSDEPLPTKVDEILKREIHLI